MPNASRSVSRNHRPAPLARRELVPNSRNTCPHRLSARPRFHGTVTASKNPSRLFSPRASPSNIVPLPSRLEQCDNHTSSGDLVRKTGFLHQHCTRSEVFGNPFPGEGSFRFVIEHELSSTIRLVCAQAVGRNPREVL